MIKKFRENDMSVFPVIFAEFEGLMYHYSLKCDAEDTFQELTVFLLELLYKIDISRFEGIEGEGLKRYIAVSLRNKFVAFSKADAVLKKNNQFLDDFVSVETDFLSRHILKDGLDRLTQKQKEIIIFKYLHNYTNNEIAKILKISRQAVNQIKNRAVETLREYYK